jgi:glutaryl-CoA dehydrogenase (non-decarboxylating)
MPTIGEWDRKQEMNPATLPRMAELGILGINIPVRYGGQGFDYITLGLVCEELERGRYHPARDYVRSHGPEQHGAAAMGHGRTKAAFPGSAGARRKIRRFRPDRTGRRQRCRRHAATARRVGDKYILNGEKMWISLATKAHHFLVVAKTDPDAGSRGMTAFIVTRDMPGVTTGDIHGKLGVRAGSTGWVAMQDVEVPVENRLGEEGEGFKIAMSCAR